MNKPKIIIAIALASLIFTSLASFAAEPQGKRVRPKVVEISQDELESTATFVFEKVSKSVVIVEALSPDGRIQGSGVVYGNHSDGAKLDKLFSYVVTNAHVVENSNSVSVLQGGKRYRAEIDYVDDEFDLALLNVQGVLLPVSPPSSGAQLKVGERVFGIGSPLGLENTISEGIISGRREQPGLLLLQTTVAVSPGSSGGGLFDEKGRFVGITTFKLKGGENLNFAIDAGHVSEIDDARGAALTLLICTKGIEHIFRDELDALTKMVLKSYTPDGEKLSAWIKHLQQEFESTQPNSPEQNAAFTSLDKVSKKYVQIVERFLKEQGGKTANTQNKAKKAVIVCTMSDSKDLSFELDYTNRTVDGFPALFTDAEVRWTYPWGKLDYVLNRYSGSLWVGNIKRSSRGLSGQCSPVAERKF